MNLAFDDAGAANDSLRSPLWHALLYAPGESFFSNWRKIDYLA
jgi:hypothetical protein